MYLKKCSILPFYSCQNSVVMNLGPFKTLKTVKHENYLFVRHQTWMVGVGLWWRELESEDDQQGCGAQGWHRSSWPWCCFRAPESFLVLEDIVTVGESSKQNMELLPPITDQTLNVSGPSRWTQNSKLLWTYHISASLVIKSMWKF